jgi:uncharacterized protein (TIGR03382 family)
MTGSELKGEHVVSLGTCSLSKVPADLRSTLAPFTPAEPLHFADVVPTNNQILTRLELKATIVTKEDKRTINAISASVVRGGSSNGVVVFTPTAAGASGRTADGRGWENRWFQSAADPASTLTFNNNAAQPIDTIVLHWEATGQKWAMLGSKGENPEVQLVATAAGCNFELKSWQLLRDLGCEDQLFADASGNAGCTATPDDTFSRIDGGAAPPPPPPDAGQDTGAPPPPPPPPDAGTDSGSTTPPPPKDDGYSYPAPGGPSAPGGKSTGDWATGDTAQDTVPRPGGGPAGAAPGGGDESDDGKPPAGPPSPAKPKKKSSDSGCSTTPGTSGNAASGSALLALVLGSVLRRRRKA